MKDEQPSSGLILPRSTETDAGMVTLLDVMGDDFTPVAAARTSYGGDLYADPERNEKLLKYLIDHDHQGPFEFVVLNFELVIPRFLGREFLRYRTASFNEFSQRYADPTEKIDPPGYDNDHLRDQGWIPTTFRKQSKSNKQGSKGALGRILGPKARRMMSDSYGYSWRSYASMLAMGVAREQARAVLPEGAWTRIHMLIKLRNLWNLFDQRISDNAQYEARIIAEAMHDLTKYALAVLMGFYDEHP